MPPKKRNPVKKKPESKKTVKKHSHRHLPGYLMIAFGMLGLGLNFDIFSGLEWAKAYPLLAVLLGVVALVEVLITRNQS